MSVKKAADSTLYHVAPKGFWKRFRDVASANPTISSGLPIQTINRYPQPGSRPEKYNTPATKASDIAQNPYWKRDVRRNYPRLSVVAQSELSTLLIQHSTPQTIPAPPASEGKEAETGQVTASSSEAPELSAAISTILQNASVYSPDRLPPSLPTAYPKWTPTKSDPVPCVEAHDDFPMYLVK